MQIVIATQEYCPPCMKKYPLGTGTCVCGRTLNVLGRVVSEDEVAIENYTLQNGVYFPNIIIAS